ncbi:MAG TPA: lipopolysaccharide heptosyltransferase II [Pseudomonadales bacterium]
MTTRILVVGPAWVGDMVMAEPLLALLAEREPDAELHVLAPPATEPLARRMASVAATRVLEVRHGELGFRKRLRVARELKALGFSRALLLPNTLKSALIPFWAGIPRRTGWLGERRYGLLNDYRHLDPERHPLMVERFLALALPPGEPLPRPLPAPRLTVDAENRARLVRELGLSEDRPVLALCPGAEYGPAKRWPAAHFAALARHGLERGMHVWLLGSPGDTEVCAGIEALAPGVANLAGRTRLVDAVDLLSAATVAVSNDSGLMHVAGAVGARVIGIYGSTSPDFTPPLGPDAAVVTLNLPCSPCFQRTCPLGHLRCLRDLEPARVAELI